MQPAPDTPQVIDSRLGMASKLRALVDDNGMILGTKTDGSDIIRAAMMLEAPKRG